MIDYTSSQLLWPIVTSISSVAHLNGRNDILVPIISCSLLLLDLLRSYRVIINSGLIITVLIATLIDYKYARRNVILFAIAALICITLLLDINMTLDLHLATEPDPQVALIVDVLKFFVFVMHFFKSGRVYTLFIWLSTIPTSTTLISFFLQRLLGASESEVRTLVADYSLMTISYFLLLSGVLIDLGLINKSRTDSEVQSPTKETTPSPSLQGTQDMSLSDDESSDSELETQITPTNVPHVVRAKEEALHIIVASADKEHNERLSEMIKTLGHFSLVVETSEHLSDILQGQTFAALFLDLSLDGALQYVDRIRRKEKLRLPLRNSKPGERRPMPIIAMSNQLSTQEKEECMQMGLTDYISKPVKELTLDKILREQMSRTETHEPVTSVTRFKLAQAPRDPSSGRKTARQGQHSPNIDSNSEALRKVTQELEQLQKTFNFFVPPEYQELISLDGVSKLQLGDTICKSITVLFSDIRDFTTMSESMFINDLMEFLNTYLAFALPPVSEHGGFIDKFIGDSIMCIFAKPDPVEQTLGAVNCAVRMMRNLDFMAESGFNPTETGIGINTGRTIVGILGTETRMAPTALGDTVNLASRTESLCKRYGARILITEYTKEKMGPQSDELFTIRQVDHVTVKGKSSACRMYEVIDGDSEAIQALKKSILPEYNKGLEAFAQKHFELALASFNNCIAIYPEDKPSLLYVERCKELLAKLDELDLSQWEPVYKLSEK